MIFKNKIVTLFLATGLILILASVFIPNRGFRLFAPKNLGLALEVNSETSTGAVIHALDQYDETPIKQNSEIHHLDIIRTSAFSDVLIELSETQGQFRVQENSEILLEKLEDQSTLISIRSGEVFIEKFGKSPSFWIRKDGRQMTAIDYALANEKNAESLRLNGEKFNTKIDSGLSQSKIEEILTSKKSDFFRCYGQLIQKTEQANGQVLISFEISPLGKVSKVAISRSDISDISFKACLVEVVSRTTFPQFKGNTITTVFPLKFD